MHQCRVRCRRRHLLLRLANFGVALGKLQPNGLGQVGVEASPLPEDTDGGTVTVLPSTERHSRQCCGGALIGGSEGPVYTG